MSADADREQLEQAFMALGMQAMHGAFFTLMASGDGPDSAWLVRDRDPEKVMARTAIAHRFQQVLQEGHDLAEAFATMFSEGWLDGILDAPTRRPEH